MNQHRSHNSSFQHQHQLCKKWRDDHEQNDRGHSKSSKPNHQQHCSSGPPSPQTLSTSSELYERDFPLYKQPVEVGCFSLDSERRFFNDNRQMRYYVEPEKSPYFDLRQGYRDRYIKRDESVKEKLDHILRWILANRPKLTWRSDASSSSSFDVDFVTWRGHLTKLLTTPYETQEGWLLAVTKFKGTLYISEVETDAARRDRENRTRRHQEMMYWGYKFEQYMCADKMDGYPDSSGAVNTNEAFCTVVQTRLSNHRLLFSGEVDCRDKDPGAPAPPACYVELKTAAEIRTPKQRRNFHRFKLLKWWAQSFLPGVPRVVAGFRDDRGVVVSVETFRISEISRLIKAEDNCWRPTVCMNFCSDFLSFVKCVATQDHPRVVYLLGWNPGCDVTYSVHRDSSYSFLPDWYVKEMS
ncbi:decapping and exoribonuclease protein [Syngnathus scovelli]|uniref:decapping and exoribonuclease protein n=1 Tax=Syngnathus scovelli TaxID=161590 RepID=UPI00211028B3|nr:decapping and exoribonuclease protein [Syngnathus scovelli]XP_049600210.1 decapping and exoribonuclease protein [Syngnathus scovelli]XP_049600211.1 decapping and exoribonuclease protein [Syngnathus scovelli]